MQKFEYKILWDMPSVAAEWTGHRETAVAARGIPEALKKLGAEGWELVAVSGDKLYLKRPV